MYNAHGRGLPVRVASVTRRVGAMYVRREVRTVEVLHEHGWIVDGSVPVRPVREAVVEGLEDCVLFRNETVRRGQSAA